MLLEIWAVSGLRWVPDNVSITALNRYTVQIGRTLRLRGRAILAEIQPGDRESGG